MTDREQTAFFGDLWTPLPKQKAFLAAAEQYRYLLYGGSRGSAKAQPLDEPVVTPFGERPIGALRPGDTICHPSGTTTKVIAIHPQGRRPVWRVTMADGSWTRATGDHCWLAWKTGGSRKRGFKRTVQTTGTLREWLEVGHPTFLPVTAPVRLTKAYRYDYRTIDPYLLGLLLGDGHLSSKSISLTSADPLQLPAEPPWHRDPKAHNRAWTYHFRPIEPLRSQLRALGLLDTHAWDKFVPECYLWGTIEDRWALLRGLMDTDGTAADHSMSFCSTSPRLAEDVRRLVLSLGGTATLSPPRARHYTRGGKRHAARTAQNVHIKFADPSLAFGLERKAARAKPPQGMYRKIDRIEQDGEEECVCITVDHPDGQYLTRDFIVTHNSNLLRWGSLYRVIRWAMAGLPGVRVGIFSEDYPTLQDRQISKIEREFPRWLGELKSTQVDGLGFYVAEEYGSGVILLRNLDDPHKYVGGEFAGAAVEELTRIEKATFDALRGSIRWPGITDTFFWAATNPLGIGLQWVRQLWIEQDFPPEMKALAPQFHFIKALPTDNPYLTEDYWTDLRSQPPHIQRAWIEGDWYVPVGVMFEELAPELHQVPDSPVVEGAECFIAIDWGYEHEAAAGWYECTGSHQAPHVRMYREYVTTRTTPADFAAQVVSQSCTPNEVVRRVILDSAAWNTPQDGGPSPAEQMVETFQKAGMTLEPTPKGAGSRVRGWMLVHTWLQPRPGGPLLTFSTSCRKTWTQLTTLVRGEPPQNIEDLKPGQADDRADQLRYALSSRPDPPRLTTAMLREQALQERLRVDPRASDLARAQAERLRKTVAVPVSVRKPRQPRTPWSR